MCLIRLVMAFGCLLLMDGTLAERLLIDDFTLDQVGISTDQFAAYDTIDFDSPVGEYRQLWGGGASVDGNCEDTEMSAFISEGAMSVMDGPDCYGGGCVRWFGTETLDITEYDSVVLTVAEIVGPIDIRISIATNLLGAQRLDATLDRTGDFSFEIEDFIQYGIVDLTEVGMLNVCLSVEPGEFVALDSVQLAIPEPRSIALIALVLIGVFGWQGGTGCSLDLPVRRSHKRGHATMPSSCRSATQVGYANLDYPLAA